MADRKMQNWPCLAVVKADSQHAYYAYAVGMGLAPIRLNKRDQSQELRGGQADGGQPHPY
ncbi:MAG TPA: hypothetical protein VGU68_11265 [Ktedonobacteraceae bacterium]|nr:hypothetical protein [Ktedonobacteraceae bacterium]HEV2661174.1 hypothetical protein [Ktedonobacteraceae bacterium]